MEKYKRQEYEKFRSSPEVLEAIEFVSGQSLLDKTGCDCNGTEDDHMYRNCKNPAMNCFTKPTARQYVKIVDFLNENYPKWNEFEWADYILKNIKTH